ncbi:TPA: hypothetical protein ACHOSI_004682, partial [Escherichia coli]
RFYNQRTIWPGCEYLWWAIGEKYLESRSQKIKEPAGEAGSFIYYFDVKLLIVQHGISTNEL